MIVWCIYKALNLQYKALWIRHFFKNCALSKEHPQKQFFTFNFNSCMGIYGGVEGWKNK